MSILANMVASSKAVANGAISYYLDHVVSARVARFSTGVDYCEPFDPANAERVDAIAKA